VGELAEFYASGSAFLPQTKFLTSAVGARFDLANGFELGVGAVFVGGGGDSSSGSSVPVVLSSITLSTLLGPK